MTTRKDDPAKPAAGGDTSSSRPHATLDLKATVVSPPSGSKDEKQPAKDEEAAAPAEPVKASASLPGASPRGEAGAAKLEGARRPVPTPPPSKKVGGYGGFFTHLAAGIAGGVVALLAADMLASQLNLSGPADREDATAALQQRIIALEATAKQKIQIPNSLHGSLRPRPRSKASRRSAATSIAWRSARTSLPAASRPSTLRPPRAPTMRSCWRASRSSRSNSTICRRRPRRTRKAGGCRS